MSTPKFPTVAEQLLEAIAVFSTSDIDNPRKAKRVPVFELDSDDCLALVAHFREQANTLRSTQESLALCQRSHAEQLARADKMADEMRRFLPVIERAEHFPQIWEVVTSGTGIATANGYRAAIAARKEVAL